jgi:hypothetical protein
MRKFPQFVAPWDSSPYSQKSSIYPYPEGGASIQHPHASIFLRPTQCNTGLSKKMDGIWNRYNLKSTRRIYTFGVLKCSEKFKVLDLP